MNVSSASSFAATVRAPAVSREAAEEPGVRDNDGDSDDVASAPQRSATAAGVGQAVDILA